MYTIDIVVPDEAIEAVRNVLPGVWSAKDFDAMVESEDFVEYRESFDVLEVDFKLFAERVGVDEDGPENPHPPYVDVWLGSSEGNRAAWAVVECLAGALRDGSGSIHEIATATSRRPRDRIDDHRRSRAHEGQPLHAEGQSIAPEEQLIAATPQTLAIAARCGAAW